MSSRTFSPCAMFFARPGRRSRGRLMAAELPRRQRILSVLIAVFLVLAAADASRLIARPDLGGDPGARYNAASYLNEAVAESGRLEALAAAFVAAGPRGDVVPLRDALGRTADRLNALATERIQALTGPVPRLVAVREQLDALVQGNPTAASVAPVIAELRELNRALTRLASLAYAEAQGAAVTSLHHLERDHWMLAGILIALIGCSFALNFLLTRQNAMLVAARREVDALVSNLTATTAQLARANEVAQDAMAEVRQHNDRFDAALNNMSQALCMVDGSQRVIIANDRFPALFGLPPDAARPGRLMIDLFRGARMADRVDPALVDAVETAQQDLIDRRVAGGFTRESEHGQALTVSHQPMGDGGWVATYEDVTSRRTAETRIQFLARHDALTGLPNRLMLHEQLRVLLAPGGRGGRGLAVLTLNLDSFQTVNDALGYQGGDKVLRGVGERLRLCLRAGDFVARTGSDEFVILRIADDHPADAEILARRVRDSLAQPFDVDGQTAVISASIGIAIASDPLIAPEPLLQRADVALSLARTDGGGSYRFFEPEMDASVRAMRLMELDLRQALDRKELVLFYQPIIDIGTGKVCGFEALLRWHRPGHGPVSPEAFITMAEELGLIVPIGAWVVHQACRDAVTWPDHLRVAVNLSAVQFGGPTLFATVENALKESGLPARNLELEITETALLTGDADVIATLNRLRALGLRIALDDFGTGYSSLSYLLRFPFDKLKIDQSFVRDMGTRADCRAIVHSVAELAQTLGIRTTAEGVETPEQLELVREAGCSEVQGYYFDRPKSASDIRRWFTNEV